MGRGLPNLRWLLADFTGRLRSWQPFLWVEHSGAPHTSGQRALVGLPLATDWLWGLSVIASPPAARAVHHATLPLATNWWQVVGPYDGQPLQPIGVETTALLPCWQPPYPLLLPCPPPAGCTAWPQCPQGLLAPKKRPAFYSQWVLVFFQGAHQKHRASNFSQGLPEIVIFMKILKSWFW